MQKKKIILLTTSILIILSIILLIQNTNKPMPQNITEQAKANYTTEIGTQTYDITNAVLEPKGIIPTISAGMIPIKWNGENFVITTRQDKQWYDYAKGQPAYIMLNDGYYKSELEVGIKEEQLMENNVGTNITRPEDLGTICMWIPSFAYNNQDEILYIKQAHSVAGTYTMPEIFTYETEKRDFSLAGIWVECKPLTNTSEVNTKINKMNGKNNTYGFLANTIATNANNEPTYKATIETYNQYIANVVGATSVRNTQENLPNVALTTEEYPSNIGNNASTVPQITNISNLNRTILKITNSNQPEPIRGRAYYDETQEKIKIEVTYSANAIAKILDKKGNILRENSTIADSGDEIIGNGIYRYTIIDNLGNMKQVLTKVEGLKIYVIPDLETLKEFRDEVNSGNTFYGITVIQTEDIQMNKDKYTINEETGEIDFAEDAEQWEPIANYEKNTSLGFRGIYNGQGHTISGIYINNNSNYQGLFGFYQSGTIKNLGIEKSKIVSTGNYIGGIAGTARGTIMNCYNAGEVIGTSVVGGIAGESYIVEESIINCYNIGKIVSTGSYAGGIVGKSNGNISNSYNIGNINGNGYVAGISSTANFVTNCYNVGKIVSTGSYVGGIMSEASGKNISYCYNIGNINGNGYVAGIVGMTNDGTNISNCYNIGEISSSKDGCGGIIAYNNRNYTTIENCYNRGNINGSTYIGGIGGATQGGISKNYNAGKITGEKDVGGIAGLNWHGNEGSFCKNFNMGNVVGTSNTGSICGTFAGDNVITDCYYKTGTGNSNVGCISTTGEDINSRLEVLDEYKTDEYNINDGYPILSWQTDNDKLNLINSDNVFVEDTEGINNGYPLLAWQVDTSN